MCLIGLMVPYFVVLVLPIHRSYFLGHDRANVAAREEGAPTDWEPGGHDVGQHDKVGACVVSASMVVDSGHQHRMDGRSLPPKTGVPCY
jgi:hypothetical protein